MPDVDDCCVDVERFRTGSLTNSSGIGRTGSDRLGTLGEERIGTGSSSDTERGRESS